MNWLEQADAHHLGDPARIMPVSLVELGRERRLHVPCLDADYRDGGFRQSSIDVLREHPGFETDANDRKRQ